MHQNPTRLLEERVEAAERTIAELRATVEKIEREVVVLRADFERLRVETQQAVGAKLL